MKNESIESKSPSISSFLALLFAATVVGCASGQPQTIAVYQPTFEFVPPVEAPVSEAGVVVAVLSPEYPPEEAWALISPTFVSSMAKDFEQLLVARGFTLRGPYRSYDEIVYADKEGSHVLMTPRLDVTLHVDDLDIGSKSKFNLLGPNTTVYTINRGTVTVGGRVTLQVSESMTRERLWNPSIELPRKSVTFEGQHEFEARPTGLPMEDPGFRSAVAKALEETYAVIMRQCWDTLDPAELQVLKQQAAQIRERAGYRIGT